MSSERRTFYAHTREKQSPSTWQPLREHLETVAELAGGFASAFDAEEWGRLAGLWHDLGKYRTPFQEYLHAQCDSGGDHSAAGALLAQQVGSPKHPWPPLAFAIAGHHAGLANRTKADGPPKPLTQRLEDVKATLGEALENAPRDLVEQSLPELPERLRSRAGMERGERDRLPRSMGLWIRFVFSALVDADFLDTEGFYHGDLRRRLGDEFAAIPELRERLDAHVDQLSADASGSKVNCIRAEVLTASREAAERAPGFFSMSVPTGGGKTLASMSFALRHAERHGLRRVIVVIPLTSILEQSAKAYRVAFGDAAAGVIEHHSNLDPEKETRRNKLASENWDAPVIVTTAVQFFESLFANRTSRCRKVHNVARSVIVLDEAQTVPPAFLLPILETLEELVEHYGCSVVLSTATQPALNRREALPAGLVDVREMMPEPKRLAEELVRFRVQWPDPDGPPTSWEELADEMLDSEQVLAVVHKRNDARDLARLLPEEGLFHLSASMCAAHRAERLAEVHDALGDERPCRLVSTQLIEAGVDVDFPLVFRALAGLDSILQAGGRCNREGLLELGLLRVFLAATKPPPGIPRKGMEATRILLNRHGAELDLFDPAMIEEYFRLLYGATTLDEKQIRTEQQEFNFRTVARRFRLIQDDYAQPLVVPWGEGPARLERFRRTDPRRDTLRALQPFVVNVATRDLERLQEHRAVELVHDTVWSLSPDFSRLYDERYGFVFEADQPERGVLFG